MVCWVGGLWLGNCVGKFVLGSLLGSKLGVWEETKVDVCGNFVGIEMVDDLLGIFVVGLIVEATLSGDLVGKLFGELVGFVGHFVGYKEGAEVGLKEGEFVGDPKNIKTN